MTKPFLKWAGGKSQLIDQISQFFPKDLGKTPFNYIEPFVGGGAMLFYMLQQFPNMKSATINDVNSDLINCYKVVKKEVEELINILKKWQDEYYSLSDKKDYFYEKRALFNQRKLDLINQSALLIFLNRTCFNGLYRVNKNNQFNVPIGSYKRPLICDEQNLRKVSFLLQKVNILNGDYEKLGGENGGRNFFYFDPPYRPLSETSSFNSYANKTFGDSEQIRLKEFCDTLTEKGDHWLLSNSDPKVSDKTDGFFDDLYKNYKIRRLLASRRINSKSEKRGEITELLIGN